MAAALDSLKAAGLAEATQLVVAVSAGGPRAGPRQRSASRPKFRIRRRSKLGAQPRRRPGPGANRHIWTQSLLDALKAAGRLQANQSAAQAVQEAAQQTRVDAQQQAQAQVEAAQAPAQAQGRPRPRPGHRREPARPARPGPAAGEAAGPMSRTSKRWETAQEGAEQGRVAIEHARVRGSRCDPASS